MAFLLKVIGVISLVFGSIGAVVLANVGPEFSFMTFLVGEIEVIVSFLTLFGIGSIWGRQDDIAAEHAEIIRILRGSEPKKEKDIKVSLSRIENQQLQILDILKSKTIETEQKSNESTTSPVETKEEKTDDAPKAFIVERTYEDIKKRKSVSGWKCSKCGTSNPMSRRTCSECGEPR